MATSINKAECTKSTSDKPKLIGEGILMYTEKIDIKSRKIAEMTKRGYLVIIGNKSFILEIDV